MIKTMYIGSGDIHALMSAKNSQAHLALLQRFVSNIIPYYNAKASPIDALRTGAILEDRYLLTLPDNYFPQVTVYSQEMNVFKCTLDFAKIQEGKIVDFDELKTIYLTDYLEFETLKKASPAELLQYICRKYKPYYCQIQQQLFCTNLDEANLVFLSVTNYDDELNRQREIQPNEYFKIRIKRNNPIIEKIKKRGHIFQQLKDYYHENTPA